MRTFNVLVKPFVRPIGLATHTSIHLMTIATIANKELDCYNANVDGESQVQSWLANIKADAKITIW